MLRRFSPSIKQPSTLFDLYVAVVYAARPVGPSVLQESDNSWSTQLPLEDAHQFERAPWQAAVSATLRHGSLRGAAVASDADTEVRIGSFLSRITVCERT